MDEQQVGQEQVTRTGAASQQAGKVKAPPPEPASAGEHAAAHLGWKKRGDGEEVKESDAQLHIRPAGYLLSHEWLVGVDADAVPLILHLHVDAKVSLSISTQHKHTHKHRQVFRSQPETCKPVVTS